MQFKSALPFVINALDLVRVTPEKFKNGELFRKVPFS